MKKTFLIKATFQTITINFIIEADHIPDAIRISQVQARKYFKDAGIHTYNFAVDARFVITEKK